MIARAAISGHSVTKVVIQDTRLNALCTQTFPVSTLAGRPVVQQIQIMPYDIPMRWARC